MRNEAEHQLNEAAYDQLSDELERRYPLKQFVAFGHGQVIGDSADFDELIGIVEKQGRDPREVMVVRIGDERPKHATIFSPLWRIGS